MHPAVPLDGAFDNFAHFFAATANLRSPLIALLFPHGLGLGVLWFWRPDASDMFLLFPIRDATVHCQ